MSSTSENSHDTYLAHDHEHHDSHDHNTNHEPHDDHDHDAHSHAEHENHTEHEHLHSDHQHAGHDAAHDHGLEHSHDFSFDAASMNLENFFDAFLHLALEFSAIFLGMSILMGLVLAYVPLKKIQSFFAASHGRGHMVAFAFGALTPLCTFSTIPMLQGLLRAKVSFGPAMTFLLCSPLVSPIIMALMFTTFGFYFTFCYTLSVALFAVGVSFCLQKCHFERHLIQNAVENPHAESCCGHAHPQGIYSTPNCPPKPSFWHHLRHAVINGFVNFKQAFPYLLMGIVLGALVYSFAPQSFLVHYTHDDSLASLGLAALMGLPLHVHLETIIPASKILLEKGMGLGSIMAFFVGSGGVSITSIILLKSFFKTPLIVAICLSVFLFAIAMGLFFPLLVSA